MITTKEAKRLLWKGCPVTSGGIEYRKMSALIFRKELGDWSAYAELESYSGRSVTIADLRHIETTGKEPVKDVERNEILSLLAETEKDISDLGTSVRQGRNDDAEDAIQRAAWKLIRLSDDLKKEKEPGEEGSGKEEGSREEEQSSAEKHEEDEGKAIQKKEEIMS